jgi:adenylosuccinate lyase
MYSDRQALARRVSVKEQVTKHQMVALNQVLEEDYPDVSFHYGLTSEDIMHNARWTQVHLCILVINELLREVEIAIREYEKQLPTAILAHTHGQPATPVFVGPYLRAKCRRIGLVVPEYRLGGSNGQLTALQLISGITDFKPMATAWTKKVLYRLAQLEKINIVTPTPAQGLLQLGPSNEATLLSGVAVAVKMRALARALWDHCQRKLLLYESGAGQAGSSAMPHKVNPIDFENAEGAFTNAERILLNAFEANSDTRGLRDLSNSIINRQMLEGWAYLYLGLKGLTRGMSKTTYSPDRAVEELRENPECLTEVLRYYLQEKEGLADPYWELKQNPPGDFDETVKRLGTWGDFLIRK